jgi:hypothetical protein
MKIMIKLEAEDTPAELVEFRFRNPFIFKFELEKDYKNGCVGTTWIGIKNMFYRIEKIYFEKGESAKHRIKRKQKAYKSEMKLKTQYFTEEAIEEHCPRCRNRWTLKNDYINLWTTAYCPECENVGVYKLIKKDPEGNFDQTLDELKKSWYNFTQELKGTLKPKRGKNADNNVSHSDSHNSRNDSRDLGIFKFLETGKGRFKKIRLKHKRGNARSDQKTRGKREECAKNA